MAKKNGNSNGEKQKLLSLHAFREEFARVLELAAMTYECDTDGMNKLRELSSLLEYDLGVSSNALRILKRREMDRLLNPKGPLKKDSPKRKQGNSYMSREARRAIRKKNRRKNKPPTTPNRRRK